MTDENLPPAGWYPDPSGAVQERYWDGTKWTDQSRGYSAPSAAVPAAPAVNQVQQRKSMAWVWVLVSAGVAVVVIAGLVALWLVLSKPSVPVPSSFDNVDDMVTALADRGIDCPGTESLGPLQRSCSSDFALTVWPTPYQAEAQARENVSILEGMEIENEGFIVVLNGLISPPDGQVDEFLTTLEDLNPTLIN